MAIPYWHNNPTSWDTLIVNGKKLPGRAVITGGLTKKIDVKNSPETDGATITLLGSDPAKFDVTLTLWLPEHLTQWEKVSRTLAPSRSKDAGAALNVAHPALLDAGISRAFIEKRGLLKQSSMNGAMEVSLSFIEVRKTEKSDAKKVESKPKVSIGDLLGAFDPSTIQSTIDP